MECRHNYRCISFRDWKFTSPWRWFLWSSGAGRDMYSLLSIATFPALKYSVRLFFPFLLVHSLLSLILTYYYRVGLFLLSIIVVLCVFMLYCITLSMEKKYLFTLCDGMRITSRTLICAGHPSFFVVCVLCLFGCWYACSSDCFYNFSYSVFYYIVAN